jgi:DNA-binding CsgD family transcriptional regulator
MIDHNGSQHDRRLPSRSHRALSAEVLHAVKESLRFSDAEMGIARLLLAGHGRENVIARRLGISPSAVSTHLQHMYAKTGTKGRGQLVGFLFAEYLEHVDRPPDSGAGKYAEDA